MWPSSKGSVSAPTMASTTAPSFIRWPQRSAGIQYWARLMLSAPPPTAMSASPSRIACAAETIACMPLPHSRLVVKAGVSTGSPASIAATRDRYMSRTSVWITLPNTTCPISAGSTPARATDSRTTAAASSVSGLSLRLPPYLPIAVRTALSTTTSRSFVTLNLLVLCASPARGAGREDTGPARARRRLALGLHSELQQEL